MSLLGRTNRFSRLSVLVSVVWYFDRTSWSWLVILVVGYSAVLLYTLSSSKIRRHCWT